jgi:hypothetical protein
VEVSTGLRRDGCGTARVAASFAAPGGGPQALAFDGQDLWMTDDSAAIFQVNIGGQVDASYQAPDASPEGLTWDGRSFWVTRPTSG